MTNLTRNFAGLAAYQIPSDPVAAAYQTRLRMVLAAASYAYEVESSPIISDKLFDELALRVDLTVDTHRPSMDEWFRSDFTPYTGSWIWKHPDPEGIVKILSLLRSGKTKIGQGL